MTRFRMSINGTSVESTGSFAVINPATGLVFAQAPECSPEQLDQAMAAAAAAFQIWKSDDGARRSALRAAAATLVAGEDLIAPILTAEQGKPLADTRREVRKSAAWLSYYADLEMPREIVQDNAQGFAEVLRRPLGVVAAIAPWNVPLVLAIWKIAPALRAGNTMVLKPSRFTPLSTLVMGELLQQVLPAGVLNVICGRDPLGAAMCAHAVPKKISFTGSTNTGKRVAAAAAADLKRVTLELGGNDPAIVLDDADPGQIADSVFWGAFANNGQICLAIKRLYVPQRLHAAMVEALAERARSVRVDDGTVEGVRLGPLNNRPQFDRVSDLVADAIRGGAAVAAGGKPIDRPGYFFEPTILSNVDDGIRIVDQEQFGPALPVIAYRNVDDVIGRANRSHYGLTASVWSRDLPFGGHKWSGLGVENGPWGLHAYTELQVLTHPPRS